MILYRRIKDTKIFVFVFVSAVKYIYIYIYIYMYIYRCIKIITIFSKIITFVLLNLFIHHIIEFVIQKKNLPE